MYKYAVIGKGMFGTAAAKYLTEMSDSVVLIGPDEPRDWKVHNGVFASHYDSGRITRIFDSEYEWALAAKNSIERYKVIETESSIQFFHPVGCIKVVPDGEKMQPYIDANEAVANRLDSPTMKLSATSLHSKYPYLSLPPGSVGLLESHSAGWIDPRKLVQAQQIIAKQNGAQVISETVIERKVAADGTIELHTDTGRIIQAEHILVTAGGFTNFNNLLPRKLKLIPRAETTVRILIAEQDWMQLQSMPALIVFLENNPNLRYVYIVPPARYPDNRLYIKIGGDREGNHIFQSLEDLQEWFHSDGGLQAAVDFKSILDELLTGIRTDRWYSQPCVITDTATSRPYIGAIDDRHFVAVGGCGAAAKSSDEFGRLAALAMQGKTDPAYPENAFRVVFDDEQVDPKDYRKYAF